MRTRLDAVARAWSAFALVGWLVLVGFVLGIAEAGAAPVEPNPAQPPPQLERRRDAAQTTVEQVSTTVMCPSCDTTLDQSDSPAAERMRAWVVAAVDAGWTEQEIRDGLVEEYGGDESVLATPRASGLGLAVWLVPAAIAAGALLVGLGAVRSWRRAARLRAAARRG